MVYSTCTIAPEENEAVISYLLEKYPEAELLPIEIPGFKMRSGVTHWQGASFDSRVKKCARILPQDNDTAPFFIARITKRGVHKPRMQYLGKIDFDNVLSEAFTKKYGANREHLESFAIFKGREMNYISTPEVFSFREVHAVRKGLEFGKIYDQDIKPDNDFVQLFGRAATRNVVDLKEWQLKKFLKGEIVKLSGSTNIEKGFLIVRYKDLPIGVGRYNGKEIKSAVKRERRIP